MLEPAAVPAHRFTAAERHGLPPAAQARVTLAYAQAALDEAAGAGLGPADLGLPVPLTDPLPALAYMAALEAAARQGGGEDFGLRVGARMHTATYVAYGHVVLSCPDFAAAAVQTRRFEGLSHDLGRTELLVEGPVARYLWHCPWLALQPGRQVCESVMAGIWVYTRWLARRDLPLRALAFPHADPGPAARARLDAFFGVPVSFGAPVTCAWFDADLLAQPIPGADAALRPVLERHAEQLLAARERALAASGPAAALPEQVRRLIAERLEHDGARIPAVAQALGLSARTLQRRLAEAGTHFQALLEATRRELADQYLQDPALTLTEVAFLLGYAEQSSFTHAYRAWHGCAPQQARRRPWHSP